MSFQDLEAGGRRPLSSRRDLINAKQDPTQVVASGIFQINTAVSTFHCLVNTLGTLKDTPELREKLHKTRLHIGQLVKDTSAKLKQASETHHGANVGASKKIVDAKLAKDFQAVLKEFQKAQRLAAERETTYSPFVSQVVLPSSYTASEIDISSDKTSEQRALLVEARRQEVLLLDNEISFNEAVIEEREQGIHEIQQQIGEVNEIFKDLVVLVHDQGAMIDDIGSNVENAHAATAQGRSHLAKASKNQRSNSSLPLTALFLASRYAYTTFVHLTGVVIKLVLVILLSRLSIAISSHESSSTTNQYSKTSYDANSNELGSNLLPCEERYLTEAYFREYDSLVDSSFQQFVLHKLPVGSGKAFPMLLGLDRHLIGEGSHRCLSSSIRFSLHPNLVPAFSSQLCEVIIIERLPSGVFADPFEIEHLLQHRVFKDASVFGDVNLELPSFRSNRSVVEVHLDAILNKSSPHENIQEVKIEIPLHARYPPLEDSGYSKVRFGVPDLTIRCKMPENLHTQSCLVTPIASNGGLKHNDVVWSIPAGIEAHAGTVSVVTFASALLSAILIIIASFQHSHVDSDERLKRS